MTSNTMKTTKLIFTLFLMLAFTSNAEAQFLKKLAKKAEKKIKREAENRSERRVNKGIDKVFDEVEDEIDGKNKKNKKNKEGSYEQEEDYDNQGSVGSDDTNTAKRTKEKKKNPTPKVVWSRYDFVPGDEVIFEDAPSIDEENGEFPSRWDLVKGNCEIIEVNGEKVVAFPKGGTIIPYLKNSKEDYLPEIFTIEFDAWLCYDNQRNIYITWFDKKNQRKKLHDDLEINSYSLEVGNIYQELEKRTKHNGKWRHISIAFTRGKLKAYLDDTRLINIPHYEGNPSGITINCSGYSSDKPEQLQYIKNFRIAKGGVKYYDRAMQDGKIVVNGIKFDVNKTTLKPESIGPINKIFKLMQKKPELNFSVEGHTDSDGSDDNNQTLSERRAKTVMNKLIEMGISQERLNSKGWGESKPIAGNDTAEGKANNRRVEFVKF